MCNMGRLATLTSAPSRFNEAPFSKSDTRASYLVRDSDELARTRKAHARRSHVESKSLHLHLVRVFTERGFLGGKLTGFGKAVGQVKENCVEGSSPRNSRAFPLFVPCYPSPSTHATPRVLPSLSLTHILASQPHPRETYWETRHPLPYPLARAGAPDQGPTKSVALTV
ncbi:hypothetical protein ACLOJK_011003 [Asimina triloba]